MFRDKGKVVCQWLVLSLWLLSLIGEFHNVVIGLFAVYTHVGKSTCNCQSKVLCVCSSKRRCYWLQRCASATFVNLTLGHDFWLHVSVV